MKEFSVDYKTDWGTVNGFTGLKPQSYLKVSLENNNVNKIKSSLKLLTYFMYIKLT